MNTAMKTAWIVMKTALAILISAVVLNSTAFAQSDTARRTLAITYPLDQTVEVTFRGTTRLPRLKGDAKIKRQGRRGTNVKLNIENLPRAYELGGIYTTYVLWAISPQGKVENLGEIKRSGSSFVDSKIEVTTVMQTFALIVTAEPHFAVNGPSRMVVMENLSPTSTRAVPIETMQVQYIGNTSDYFRDPNIPGIAEADYTSTPTVLLEARQALNLARYAGADQDAPNELRAAEADLQQAEGAWHMKGSSDREIDLLARTAVNSGEKAEEMAIARRASRLRREEAERNALALRKAEDNATDANQKIDALKRELENERHARELAERDSANATEQLRDARTEIARLRDEIQQIRAESEDAKVKLARIEGERQADEARRVAEKRASDQRTALESLKQAFARFGAVHDSSRGFTLTLPESLWANPRGSSLTAAASAKLEPLAALLANNPDFQIVIESYTDDRGNETSLQQLTQDRARVLSEKFAASGVDVTRMQANGMGGSNPVAPNTTVSSRARNRRTEITLIAPIATASQ